MRIRKIKIEQWRNIKDIEIDLPDDASLVCLVGANGTGKTHILELISACAHHIGLSPGIEIPRGNPFDDPIRNFSIDFYLARGISETIDSPIGEPNTFAAWDRTLRIDGTTKAVTAGGVEDPQQSVILAQGIINRLRTSQDVYHLTLDADRAFPKKKLQTHEMAQAFETKWNDTNWIKARAYQTTRTLYDEWIKFCLAKENAAANLFYQEARRATESNSSLPVFKDAFHSYRTSLRKVMPHLLFAGANQEKKALLFDTCGLELLFDQLSGGEREIAFLIGQIDRFNLKNGIFLLDEPELHLNPDLVRTWVTYLGNTIHTGQVWLATHSLEAVEATGLNNTILLERDDVTKKVHRASNLSDQPVLSALSRAVGTPAFSINNIIFIFIEGEEAIGERERYRRIIGAGSEIRFIECGSCSEVIRRQNTIRDIAKEVQQPIQTLGIIDRDWRSRAQIQTLTTSNPGIIALPVHEIENLFLHKETLIHLAKQNGITSFEYYNELRKACDIRAGGWIIQSALSDETCRDISSLPKEARELAYGKNWQDFEAGESYAINEIIAKSQLEGDLKIKLTKRLLTFAAIYKRKRSTEELWRICEGKEVMKTMAVALGFSDHHVLEKAILAYWDKDEAHIPEEVLQLRGKIDTNH
ncbi:AAA family ATPase [Pseudodesulfovibrio sp.]|uniref:AAA family ATPase n=1 Tax=Pseudodesulfovibrio sp. TaxID=2035812 RepID=UPI003D147C53